VDTAGPTHYRIIVGAQLDPRWSDWFDGMLLADGPGGEAVLSGPVADQAALHGLLAKIRDLGLPLVAVYPVPSGADREP
jgi:hypothetical protein